MSYMISQVKSNIIYKKGSGGYRNTKKLRIKLCPPPPYHFVLNIMSSVTLFWGDNTFLRLLLCIVSEFLRGTESDRD